MNENQVESIRDICNDIDTECGEITNMLSKAIEMVYELKLPIDHEQPIVDELYNIKKHRISEIQRLQDKIDDEAIAIETECDCDIEESHFDNVIIANEEIEWSATNFVDKQVVEQLNTIYEQGGTSLAILEHLTKFKTKK